MLEIKDLHVRVGETAIIDGLSLCVNKGETAAIMGPNGSGKSTLSYALAGRPGYEIVSGSVTLDGVDLTDLSPDQRAARGLFLAFQYPLDIPGVTTMTFLKATLNAQRRARGEEELPTAEFMRRVRAASDRLGVAPEMLRRAFNVGFSGGEKKRMEILHMTLLEPSFGILDETDSGLDIDALQVVSAGVNALRDAGRSFLMITHYQRLLEHIVPDRVHVMVKGKIVASGGPALAHELEKNGYRDYRTGESA